MEATRLNKYLAQCGVCSRREADKLIESGKVFVNGKLILSNGYQIKENDIISVRGYGKYVIACDGSLTKKGRYHIDIRQYT